MASIQSSNGVFFGEVRHYKDAEYIYFHLTDGAGAPFSGGTIGTGAGKVAASLVLPDLTTHDIHTAGVPATCVEEVTASSGFYRMRLFGSGQSSPHNKPLLQAGRYGIRIYSTVGEFETIVGQYDVKPHLDVSCAFVYTPSSGAGDALRGALTFYHWNPAELLTAPKTALTSLTVRLRDETGTAVLALTTLATDFTEQNDALFFSAAVAGLSGNHVLVARVTAVYQGVTLSKDFLVPARFAG